MRRRYLQFERGSVVLGALVIALALTIVPVRAAADDGVVRGVLFYAPTCSHCHYVMAEVLPPLRDRYGDNLVIAEVDVTTPEGGALWGAAVQKYEPAQVGVPMLAIGDRLLIGSVQIPEELPGLIEAHLVAGGVGWPDLAGIDEIVGDVESVPGKIAPEEDPALLATAWQRFTQDPVGNTLSLIVLIALIAGLVAVIKPRNWQTRLAERVGKWVFVPLLVGLVAALYLAYAETAGTEAVCGPVGDCNAVQQSEYALLFGFLPVAVLGVIGYVALVAAYGVQIVYDTPWVNRNVPGLIFLMALFGLILSTFLTFLEPFVIGATCAWCLTSAVCMLLVALVAAGPGWASLRPTALKRRRSRSRA